MRLRFRWRRIERRWRPGFTMTINNGTADRADRIFHLRTTINHGAQCAATEDAAATALCPLSSVTCPLLLGPCQLTDRPELERQRVFIGARNVLDVLLGRPHRELEVDRHDPRILTPRTVS